jgi:peroxiredoxin
MALCTPTGSGGTESPRTPTRCGWRDPRTRAVHDGTETEHGFVSFVPEGGGVRAFWLDGRLMAGEGPMTLRTASVGAEAGGDTVLDDRVCECCQTSAVVTAEGPLVVYRDRSDSEVRDIYSVRREGRGWSEPAPVHRDGWEIPGCPVNGPAAAAKGRRVVVAWITSEAGHSRVLASFSADAGLSFGDPVVVDDTDPLGRVGVVLTGNDEAVVTWLDGEGEEAGIRARRVSPRGGAGPSLRIGHSTKARGSGFPRVAASGDDLFMAWTEAGNPSRLRMARVSLPGLPEIGAMQPEGVAAARGPVRPWDRRAGSVVPEFSARALDGRSRTLSEYEGEALLVNLWATWCGPCREEIPDLIRLHRRHEAEGLKILGLSVDAPEAAEEIRTFVQAQGIPYEILHDTEGGAATLFGVDALPASFLFDRRGVLVWSRYGLVRAGDPALVKALSLALSAEAAPAGAPR